MKVIISSNYTFHETILAFERTIQGPKIKHFQELDYGSDIRLLSIMFDLQNPEGTVRHRTKYVREQKWLHIQIVLSDELNGENQRESFEKIIFTLLSVIAKSIKKTKATNFNGAAFQTELAKYLKLNCNLEINSPL